VCSTDIVGLFKQWHIGNYLHGRIKISFQWTPTSSILAYHPGKEWRNDSSGRTPNIGKDSPRWKKTFRVFRLQQKITEVRITERITQTISHSVRLQRQLSGRPGPLPRRSTPEFVLQHHNGGERKLTSWRLAVSVSGHCQCRRQQSKDNGMSARRRRASDVGDNKQIRYQRWRLTQKPSTDHRAYTYRQPSWWPSPLYAASISNGTVRTPLRPKHSVI